MSQPVPIAGMTDFLSREEVEALAERLGLDLAPGTRENYARQGLLAKPIRTGRGRGRGVEFLWPPVTATQLEAIVAAQKYTHSWAGLRHWMWWQGLPIEWERWRADRVRGLARSARVRGRLSGMTQHQRAREALVLTRAWAGRRPRPLRLDELWGAPFAVREGVATWMIDILSGDGGLPSDFASPFDGGPTVGHVIDHVFGVQRLRDRGVDILGESGESASKLLPAAPSLAELAADFALLTESEAKGLRDAIKELELCMGGRYYVPRVGLSAWPELAAVALSLMALNPAGGSQAP